MDRQAHLQDWARYCPATMFVSDIRHFLDMPDNRSRADPQDG
jgi:hypothetical protein